MEVEGSVRPPGSEDTSAPRRNIPHEELMQLPVVKYHGKIHLIATADDLPAALKDIHEEKVVGFDTETRPTFRKGQFHSPSLVQIATAQVAYLFPIARVNCADILTEILESKK